MIIEVSNNLTVSEPTDKLKIWCKENLILINPEYEKKRRMGFWVGNTPKTISLFEVRGDKLILPYGTLSIIPRDILSKALIINAFKPSVSVDYKGDVPLYDYQETAVKAMIDAKFGILQSAAGSGKTQMGIAIATRLQKRTLWLCHTLDLINQSKERAERYISKDLIGTISEGQVHLGTGITFATIQTMAKLDLSQYKDYWDCIITDEVHRVSGSPTAVTQYQKVLNGLSARHKYGLSATVHRSDGMIEATYALVGKVAYKVPDEAVKDKIMQVGICPVFTGTEIKRQSLNTDGTLNYAKLITQLATDEKRNKVIAGCIMRECSPSLILSERLNHLEDIISLLPAVLQKHAVMISGKTKKEVRDKALEQMRNGEKQFLFATYSLAKEGLDVPRLERLYLATPQKDYAVVTQSIGRIARTCNGKDKPVAYDFVDDIGYLVKSYKKRCAIYRKNNCYFVEDGE